MSRVIMLRCDAVGCGHEVRPDAPVADWMVYGLQVDDHEIPAMLLRDLYPDVAIRRTPSGRLEITLHACPDHRDVVSGMVQEYARRHDAGYLQTLYGMFDQAMRDRKFDLAALVLVAQSNFKPAT